MYIYTYCRKSGFSFIKINAFGSSSKVKIKTKYFHENHKELFPFLKLILVFLSVILKKKIN